MRAVATGRPVATARIVEPGRLLRHTTIPDAIAQASKSGWAINRWGNAGCQQPARRRRQPVLPGNRNGFEAWELYGARDTVDRRLVTAVRGYQPPGPESTYRQHDSLAGGAVMPTMTVDIHCWLAVSLGKLTRWAEAHLRRPSSTVTARPALVDSALSLLT